MSDKKTNATYTQLAYRKAILMYVMNHLTVICTGENGSEADESIMSDDVFSSDSKVDESDIHLFVKDLRRMKRDVEYEMTDFDFNRKTGEPDEPVVTELTGPVVQCKPVAPPPPPTFTTAMCSPPPPVKTDTPDATAEQEATENDELNETEEEEASSE